MVTPTKKPTMAVREEKKFRSRAVYHERPEERSIA
jgi:hypothetical protein